MLDIDSFQITSLGIGGGCIEINYTIVMYYRTLDIDTF